MGLEWVVGFGGPRGGFGGRGGAGGIPWVRGVEEGRFGLGDLSFPWWRVGLVVLTGAVG